MGDKVKKADFTESSKLTTEDKLKDKIGKLLNKYRSIPTNTNEKKELLAELIEECNKEEYKKFIRDYRTFALQLSMGDSYIYKVPTDRKGYLADYRGKSVRFICVGRNKEERTVMIKEVK